MICARCRFFHDRITSYVGKNDSTLLIARCFRTDFSFLGTVKTAYHSRPFPRLAEIIPGRWPCAREEFKDSKFTPLLLNFSRPHDDFASDFGLKSHGSKSALIESKIPPSLEHLQSSRPASWNSANSHLNMASPY